jgi:sec-independent protein translocase protein TatC
VRHDLRVCLAGEARGAAEGLLAADQAAADELALAAAACLAAVKPLVRLLEMPAEGIRFLQLAPGEFLFVSLKVAGYAGLTLALPYVLYEGLAFVLPGLTRRERRLVAPAVAGSAVLFAAGLAFAWWALVPAALRFLVSYGADVVEPSWSIEQMLNYCKSFGMSGEISQRLLSL